MQPADVMYQFEEGLVHRRCVSSMQTVAQALEIISLFTSSHLHHQHYQHPHHACARLLAECGQRLTGQLLPALVGGGVRRLCRAAAGWKQDARHLCTWGEIALTTFTHTLQHQYFFSLCSPPHSHHLDPVHYLAAADVAESRDTFQHGQRQHGCPRIGPWSN
jgi:hypothetical protein